MVFDISGLPSKSGPEIVRTQTKRFVYKRFKFVGNIVMLLIGSLEIFRKCRKLSVRILTLVRFVCWFVKFAGLVWLLSNQC